MVDQYLTFTIVATLMVVPFVSYIVDRMHTLPVDLVSAALAVVIFFIDAAARFIQSQSGMHINPDAILVFSLALLISALFSILCVGMHTAITHERKSLNLTSTAVGNLYIELGYAISLLLSIVFLIYAFSITAAVPIIFSPAAETSDTLFSVLSNVGEIYPNILIMAAICGILYAFFIIMRYWHLIDTQLRKFLT